MPFCLSVPEKQPFLNTYNSVLSTAYPMIDKCPKCAGETFSKAGLIADKQRFKCKDCGYHFTVGKDGKSIDPQIVKRALQLYLEGMSYREIETVLGVSHVSVMNWVKKHNITRPEAEPAGTRHQLLPHEKLVELITDEEFLNASNVLISNVNGRYMVLTFNPPTANV